MELSSLVPNPPPPIAIGGVGGSGTRLIASFLEELDFYIGSDLNEAKDNLWFTLLFKHIDILNFSNKQINELLTIFYQGMLTNVELSIKQKAIVNNLVNDKRHLPKRFFQERAEALFSSHTNSPKITKWGWKEPNTHIILDTLVSKIPNIKYIHVMRNGLDMAYSTNQNQQFLWGKRLIGDEFISNPYYSLKYWCFVHKRLLKISKNMGNNFLLLNFDKFCTQPDVEIPKFFNFLGIKQTENDTNKIKSLIKIPNSIGRYKRFGTKDFDMNDLYFVEKLGFII